MPLYNLIEALEQKGGDINAILPPLSPLLSVTKDHHEDNLTSLYWLHALYTDAFGRARVDSWDGKRAYPENLAKPILALAKDGKLDWAAKEVVRIFKSTRNYHREICLAQEPPFRCGQKRETTPYVWAQLFSLLSIELRDSRIVETDYSKADWKSKLFWLDQIERTDYNKGSGAFQFFMNNFVNSSYGNHLHKKAPSTSELDRLNRWIKRASNELPLFKNENLTEGEKITERFKHNLLSTLLLSQNGQVPSEAELEFFRQQAIRSNFVQKNTDSYYVTLYLYSRHLGNIWKDAPKTTQTIHHQFLTYSGGPYSLNSADDLRVALSDPQVQRELAEIERAITPLNPAERDQLLKFWQDKIPLSPMDYEKSEDLAKYLRRIRLLVSNSYQRTIAFILYVEPHIQDRGFFSFRGIETFLKFYSDHGEEKLKELLQGWEKIGLTLSNFTGEEKFLSLSENDEARISRIRPFAKYNLFLESSPLLKLTDQKFEKWFRFATRLKDQKINLSIASSLAIYDIPKINTFVKLLHDIGLFQRVVKSYSPLLLSQHFKILSKKALPLLCQNIGETKRILRRLKDQFKGYAFDEFNDPNNLLQSPVTAIHTLAALVHFELNADKMLFNAHRNPWDTYVTIVRDQRSSGKHAIYDYDPDYRFRIADYNLLRAISSKQLRSLMSGMDREELIESLLIQFAGLRIVPRQKNKLYASRESVSKALLDSLPLTELIRIQLLLNNVQDMTFRKPVHKAVEIDYDDIGGEHGGILLPAKNPEEIGSLYDPLLMNLLAGETHQTKSDIIRSLELQISNERDPQKRKVLERDLRMLTQGFDGGYNPPKRMLNSRFGWQFSLHFHAVKSHARGFRNKDLAGPSGGLGAGGDLGMTLLLGGGVVVTRLGKNHINADYYTLLPRYREGSPKAEYEALVIDLGEYKF